MNFTRAATPPINFRTKRGSALRAAIFERDDFTCQHCGWRPQHVPENYDGRYSIGRFLPHSAERTLHVDHIVPRVAGGPSTEQNLQTLCEACNCRKAGH